MTAHAAAERVFEWAWKASPGGAGLGLALGALLGWPHQHTATLLAGLNVDSYSNFWVDGDFKKVLEAGIVATGALALALALLAALSMSLYRSYWSAPGPPAE